MHDTLRRRILRRLDTLPEPQLYQVLDYIEFLESRYARGTPTDATGLQRLAEKLEDGLRKRTLNPSNLREAFQLISAADRVLGSVSEAGRQILDELGPSEAAPRRSREVPAAAEPPAPSRGAGPPKGPASGEPSGPPEGRALGEPSAPSPEG